MTTTPNDLVLCQSADGWSLHAPGSTDEDIANGDARPILCDSGKPDENHYQAARLLHARGLRCGDHIQVGRDADRDTGRIVYAYGPTATIVWDSGVRTPCPIASLEAMS